MGSTTTPSISLVMKVHRENKFFLSTINDHPVVTGVGLSMKAHAQLRSLLAGDHLLVHHLDDVKSRLDIYSATAQAAGQTPRTIELPSLGSVTGLSSNHASSEVLFRLFVIHPPHLDTQSNRPRDKVQRVGQNRRVRSFWGHSGHPAMVHVSRWHQGADVPLSTRDP